MFANYYRLYYNIQYFMYEMIYKHYAFWETPLRHLFNAFLLNIFSNHYIYFSLQTDGQRERQTDRQMTTRPTDARIDGRTGIPFYRDLKTDDFSIILANLP